MADHRPIDQSGLQHIIGYQIARADVPARAAFMRHIGTPFKLRPVDFSMLVLLLTNGSASPKQLAQALAVPPPHVTLLIDRLAERGLLQRQRSTSDGRALQVVLTEKGQDLTRRVHRASMTMEEDLLRPLSMAERAMLAELLEKLSRGAAPPD